ncbi:MAG: carbamoyltransferase HypF, partial [Deltaproteobacteria bacterium]|nr:carbamoyltransferase HypF [Deltaproteobacteria bacterium]
GELLMAWPDRYERRGHLQYLPLPGGAAAIKEPWRMAVSYLYLSFGPQSLDLGLKMLERQDRSQLALIGQIIQKQIRSPLTSSLGRLFDAVAALIGLRDRAAFEGQAAMMLEMCCPEEKFPPYPFDLSEEDGQWILQPQAFIRRIVSDLSQGRSQA